MNEGRKVGWIEVSVRKSVATNHQRSKLTVKRSSNSLTERLDKTRPSEPVHVILAPLTETDQLLAMPE